MSNIPNLASLALQESAASAAPQRVARTSHLPSELWHEVLGELTNADLKQTRLVCRQWSTLSMHHVELDTVYLSVRDYDMEVFDGITQHPVFSKKVKHVVFDLAQFIPLQIDDYISAFLHQVYYQYEAGVEGIDELADLLHLSDRHVWKGSTFEISVADIRRFAGNRDLVMGYCQYMQYARQRLNIMSNSWFARALRGLEMIGTVHTVTLRHAWLRVMRTALFTHPSYLPDKLPGNWSKRVRVTFCKHLFVAVYEARGDQEILQGLKANGFLFREFHDTFTIGEDFDEDAGHAHEVDDADDFPAKYLPRQREDFGPSDVFRAQGFKAMPFRDTPEYGLPKDEGQSPTARSWPPTHLIPIETGKPINRDEKEEPFGGPITRSAMSDESLEMLRLIQLLSRAHKQPREFTFPNSVNVDVQNNTPGHIFDLAKCPSSAHFHHIGGKLEVLRIGLDFSWESYPSFDSLKAVFHKDSPLRELSIVMGDNPEYLPWIRYHSFAQIFPPVEKLCLPNLQRLELRGSNATYRNMYGLLFISLPRLQHLALANMQLTYNIKPWRGIIEGLRRLLTLKSCKFDPLTNLVDPYPSPWAVAGDDYLLEQYAVGGLRHPCLDPNEPEEASYRFLVDVLATLDDIRSSMASRAS
ncbi:MAG: hypothetical protein Q9197_001160 [Variospora fuerteventurae]